MFVTGHTGFKGSWLCLWLQTLGSEVTGYSMGVPTSPSLFELADIASGMRASVTGDVANYDQLRAAIGSSRPEIVFHLAAQSLLRRSYERPIETYRTNVMGTVNLLEAVRQEGGTQVIINVTTDKCYESREWVWGYRENDRLGGTDPYSNSKACAELVSDAYRTSYFNQRRLRLATGRGGNVIGGGDWATERLVPDIMAAAMMGRPVEIRHPDAVRPWQHVLDCLSGYLMLAERLWQCGVDVGAWNFGPEETDSRSVRWVVERLSVLWKGGIRWQPQGGDHPHEAYRLKLDCSKARAELGWGPRWDLNKTLETIVAWYETYQAGGDIRGLTAAQIRAYAADKI